MGSRRSNPSVKPGQKNPIDSNTIRSSSLRDYTPRGGRAGRASTGHAGCQSDHSAAFNTVLPPARADRNGQDDDAGAPDVGKNHDLADSSVPVTTTNHLTQQPHVKNQPAETLTHAACALPKHPLVET